MTTYVTGLYTVSSSSLGAVRVRRAFSVGVLLLLVVGESATAHVRIDPESTVPGYTTLAFWLYHGCGEAPTISFTVKIPLGVADVTPQVKAGWKIEPVTNTYPEPVKIYGRTVRAGFTEITWSGGDIPAHYMDHFIISGFVTAGAAERLQFTTIQRCRGIAKPQESTSTVRIVLPKGAAVHPNLEGDTPAPSRSRPLNGIQFERRLGLHPLYQERR